MAIPDYQNGVSGQDFGQDLGADGKVLGQFGDLGFASADSSGVANVADLIVSSAAAKSGGSGSGASGTTITGPQSSNTSRLVINASYDSSISSLQATNSTLYAEITGVIAAAINWAETTFSNAINVTIDFGLGEVAGTALPGSALGESQANYLTSGYSTVRNALVAKSPSLASVLPTTDPTGTNLWAFSYAESKALGINAYLGGGNFLTATSTEVDGYVGISANYPMNWSTTSQYSAGQYSALGIIEHELTETLGRVSSLGTYLVDSNGNKYYTPLDLYRYAAPGTRALAPGAGYFSLNNGATNLATFNNSAVNGGDAGDWDSIVSNDSFDAFSNPGGGYPVSATDATVMSALGFTLACYLEGTRILTDRGEIPVERLAVGDQVITRYAGRTPVRWIGHRAIDTARHPDPRKVWPVRVRANAFGENLPQRDLLLSPDHAVAVDNALVPVRLLVNGATVLRDSSRRHLRYFHIELPRHDLLYAEGLAAESYLDTGNRAVFENGGQPLRLHPDLSSEGQSRREAESCLPLLTDPVQVRPIWDRLASRAARLGRVVESVPTTRDPGLYLLCDGRRIRPLVSTGGVHSFLLPVGGRAVRLCSRAAEPCAVRPWVEDSRRLGVMVQRISIRCDGTQQDVPLDSPALRSGWWAAERDAARIWRWTDGDAALPPVAGSAVIEIAVGETLDYPLDQPVRQAVA